MKRCVLLTAGLGLFALNLQATLLLYDAFDYTAGELLAPTDGSPGQFNPSVNTNWYYAGSGTGNTKPPGVGSGSLSYADVNAPGYGGLQPATGNSVLFDTTQLGAARIQVVPSSPTSGTYYYSGLLKVTSVANLNTNNGLFFASFNAAVGPGGLPSTGSAVMRLRADPTNTNNFNVGIAKTTATTAGVVQFASTSFDPGTTLFVVAAYEFVTGGTQNDVAYMWINPDVSTFGTATPPAPDLISAPSAINDLNLLSFAFRNVNTVGNPTFMFDELRVGTSWADVTPVPEPATAALLTLAAAMLLARRRMNS